jgi:uncharacterized protein YbjT (DUF2867 family)
MSKVMTLIGATGLIGGELYELLKQDQDAGTIRLIVRRPFSTDDPRTEVKLVDFNDPESLMLAMEGSDVVFCAVGTTNKKVKGDKDAYRKVDYDIPVRAARFGKMVGCENFILVSAIGANPRSRNFYLQLKGQVEEAIRETGLRSVYIMQPSILMGNRQESRPMEKWAEKLMSAFSFLLPSRYRPIHARDVAKAMLASAHKNKEGFFVLDYKKMKEELRNPKFEMQMTNSNDK